MIHINKFPNYSTTRLLTKQEPFLEHSFYNQFKQALFLPESSKRIAEGGLRREGYFKQSIINKPLLSIVTVVFNGNKFLEETIQSVLNQTYDNVEYIIIDGGSTDGTLDIIKKYNRAIDYWISEADNGLSDALNKGFMLSTGEWLFYLNSDDTLYSDYLLEDIFYKKSLKNWNIIYGNKTIINTKSIKVSERKVTSFIEPFSYWGLRQGCAFFIYLDASFFKRELFLNSNMFDTKLTNTMDTDLFLQFYKSGKAKFKYINKFIINFRVHNSSISCSRNKIGFIETRMLLNKYFKNDINNKNFPQKIVSMLIKSIWFFTYVLNNNGLYPLKRLFKENNKNYTDY